VSKRPKKSGAVLSRLRLPVGRLRDMPIWSKLGLIMIAPTIAVVVVGTNGIVDHLQRLGDANQAATLAALSQASGELVHGLQDERAGAVLLLGARSEAQRQKYLDNYNEVNRRVDDAKGPYSGRRGELDGLPANFEALLSRIDQGLGDLPGIRSQVVNGRLKLTDAAQSYEGLINDLLDMRDLASQLSGDIDLSERMRAAAATSRAKEYLSMRRVVVHRALIDGRLTPVLRTDYIATETGQQQALQSFEAVASREEADFYQQVVAGADQREADTYSGWVRGKTNESMADAPFDADDWEAAMVGNAQLMREVEARLDSGVLRQARTLRDDVRQQVFLESGLLLSMLLVAILFAYLVARSMARSLRELRQGALAIAEHGLPQAVARLRDPKLTAQMSPVQLASQIAEPMPVRSKDEFGQVTEAFNAVHLEAVRTAAEQAQLRASVSTMFVNLARRSQILVDRLIGHLDRLERGEEDPDRLAELFQLDHLATRMRRNDENLLVLAGADSTRVQREPAALIDVLRAAQSEVEHYTRIEFGVVDRDIEVQAPAVNDLVHLVAELLDNATAFSPPESQVLVEARRIGDRATLYVEDRGIGISPEQLQELNERLAKPPAVDVTVSRMMGLVVVARLASRHGVHVELRPGTERGIVADVTLPASILVPRALSGRAGQAGALPAAAPQPAQPQPAQPRTARSMFGAPLALESGSGSSASRPGERRTPTPFRAFEPINGGAGTTESAGTVRNMPAWSDLTGARMGRGGGDPFTPRIPANRDVEPLPQRRATTEQGTEGSPAGGTSSGFTVPRQRPASPEPLVTGAPMGSAPAAAPSEPLEPSAPATPAPSAFATPPAPAPSPLATPPSAPQVSAPPFGAAPQSVTPSVDASPMTTPPSVTAPSPAVASPAPSPTTTPASSATSTPAGAPPAWPPVNTPGREPGAPPVPERLAAALDMTAELPRTAPKAPEASTTVEPRPKFADETMELPIFREVESAWFRTRRKPEDTQNGSAASSVASQVAPATGWAAGQTSTAPTGGAAMVESSTAAGQSLAGGNTATGSGAGGPTETASGWRTAADEGWRAAMAATVAARNASAQTTRAGLPKRVPMAQLVPGAVERPTTSMQRRTPEAVRGLLSAYHRGVQRGRTHPTSDQSTRPGAIPAGPVDVGPANASGQKEHEG